MGFNIPPKQPFREVGIPLQIQIPLPDRPPVSHKRPDEDQDTYGISFPMSDGPNSLTISPDDDDVNQGWIPLNGSHYRPA